MRLWVLPARGLVGDIDQFVLWVHGIAVNGWDRAYDQNLSFPAVMAWVWGALAALEPAFRTVTDSADPGIRSLMKIPASLADLGIAAAAIWWFRDRPKLALLAAGAVLLWPATWYVSAWWGQYESIYVLGAVLALLAARGGLPLVTAALLAVSLMTKPQALPFLVPFGAWFLATQGIRGTLKAAAVGAVVVVLLWLPFIAAGGPGNYLNNLATYQNERLRDPVAQGVESVGPAPGARRERPVRVGPHVRVRSGHVPARRLRRRRPVRADRVRRGLPAADAGPARPRDRRDLAGRVRLAHDDARAVRLPGARVPAARPGPAGRRRGVDRCSRSPSCSTCSSPSRPRAGRSPRSERSTIVGSIVMTGLAVAVLVILAARGPTPREPKVSL